MTAVGFRVKSGYAIAVVLTGSRAAPQAAARHIVMLSDPEVAETKQPYHDRFYHTEEDAREIARRVKIVKRCATQSIAALSADLCRSTAPAERPFRAALVVGSLIDPARVGNPHIRAHAHEGQLFRTVLEDALHTRDVACQIFLDKELSARAVDDLKRTATAIARALAVFGKALGGPWRAQEKAAATAAWLALGRS